MTTGSYRERIESAVRDGAMLRNDEAQSLFSYIRDLEFAIRRTWNEPTNPHWHDVKVVLDAGPIEPEP